MDALDRASKLCESHPMCGRYTLKTPAQEWLPLFDLPVDQFGDAPPRPRFNIAPTQQVITIRANAEGKRSVAEARWGLVPFWAKDESIGSRMINARSETIAEKPAFRAAFKSRRCLIVTDGFFEWKVYGKAKQPYYFRLARPRVFAFAGLWERWDKGKSPMESCTIITTSANHTMAGFHERMPVILSAADYALWLDPEFHDTSMLASKLVPLAHDELTAIAVDPIVNNPRNDVPECVMQVTE
jgi:putative SOS response-associated peptidase YedK